MDEREFKDRIEQRWERHQHRSAQGRRWVGVFLLLAGGLWVAKIAGAIDFPVWFFTWPMFLIGIGLFSGIRHGFRGFGWLVPILIGGIFLANELSPRHELRPYVWPIVLITFGLLFLFRPRKNRWQIHCEEKKNGLTQQPAEAPHLETDWAAPVSDSKERIDATAIFGGVKKNVLSKNFKGGDVTTFMGGAEINLTQADFSGKVMIDCFNMFGGTKLIIPADWEVQSDLVTIFGGIEDKRQPAPANPNKTIYLDGTCIFGGVEIKSF